MNAIVVAVIVMMGLVLIRVPVIMALIVGMVALSSQVFARLRQGRIRPHVR